MWISFGADVPSLRSSLERLRLELDGMTGEGLVFFFFFTLVTGPRRSLSLKRSDTNVDEPQIRACLGTTAHFCRVVVRMPSLRSSLERLRLALDGMTGAGSSTSSYYSQA